MATERRIVAAVVVAGVVAVAVAVAGAGVVTAGREKGGFGVSTGMCFQWWHDDVMADVA